MFPVLRTGQGWMEGDQRAHHLWKFHGETAQCGVAMEMVGNGPNGDEFQRQKQLLALHQIQRVRQREMSSMVSRCLASAPGRVGLPSPEASSVTLGDGLWGWCPLIPNADPFWSQVLDVLNWRCSCGQLETRVWIWGQGTGLGTAI